MSGKTILVTGAGGFIGTHLCGRLVRSGASVHGVSRSPRDSADDNVRWWQGELADIETARHLFRVIKPDLIIHLASHVMGAPDIRNVLPTFHGNLQTTVNLLTAAAESGCQRLVLTGSLAEPEWSAGETFPSSPYAAAKWASSAYGRMFHALYQVPVVVARVFMVYGPAQRDLSKLIPYVSISFLQEEAPKISNGERLIDWIYVDDVVEGFVSLATAPRVEGRTVDLGSGKLVSIRDIVDRVQRIVGGSSRPLFGALPNRPLEPTRTANVADTYARTGWKPGEALDTGLEKAVEWYRTHMRELVGATT
ncbi:MAG TPA: NAD(P)-dependent oxidoreductase [Bacteroidota bacterium]|nr:NAD(P)-dependent oxidoreductase [Bacteroidota bacterium]